MNPLSDYPRVRKALYTAFWVVGGVLVVWQVVVGAVPDMTQPTILTALLAAYPAAGAYIGYQAQQNTAERRVQPIAYSGDSKVDGTYHG